MNPLAGLAFIGGALALRELASPPRDHLDIAEENLASAKSLLRPALKKCDRKALDRAAGALQDSSDELFHSVVGTNRSVCSDRNDNPIDPRGDKRCAMNMEINSLKRLVSKRKKDCSGIRRFF